MKLMLKKLVSPPAGGRLVLVGAVPRGALGALAKSGAVEDEDGVLTSLGMSVAERYARAWVKGARDVELERQYPDLAGLFYDIRLDAALARRHAS